MTKFTYSQNLDNDQVIVKTKSWIKAMVVIKDKMKV